MLKMSNDSSQSTREILKTKISKSTDADLSWGKKSIRLPWKKSVY